MKGSSSSSSSSSSWSCCPSCLRPSPAPGPGPGPGPGDVDRSERDGSPLSLQARGHVSCRTSEGDVKVLPTNTNTNTNTSTLDLDLTSSTSSLPETRTLSRLYSLNGGHHLRISPDGTVSGGRTENDPYDVLRVKAVGVGLVVIRGEATGRFLAMNAAGRLYGSQTLSEEVYFLEKYEENHYNTYRSQAYGWYVALKRSGQPKPGPKTHQGQKAVYFLPRAVGGA